MAAAVEVSNPFASDAMRNRLHLPLRAESLCSRVGSEPCKSIRAFSGTSVLSAALSQPENPAYCEPSPARSLKRANTFSECDSAIPFRGLPSQDDTDTGFSDWLAQGTQKKSPAARLSWPQRENLEAPPSVQSSTPQHKWVIPGVLTGDANTFGKAHSAPQNFRELEKHSPEDTVADVCNDVHTAEWRTQANANPSFLLSGPWAQSRLPGKVVNVGHSEQDFSNHTAKDKRESNSNGIVEISAHAGLPHSSQPYNIFQTSQKNMSDPLPINAQDNAHQIQACLDAALKETQRLQQLANNAEAREQQVIEQLASMRKAYLSSQSYLDSYSVRLEEAHRAHRLLLAEKTSLEHQCQFDRSTSLSQAKADEAENMRIRLEKAERAIEEERANSQKLEAQVASQQQTVEEGATAAAQLAQTNAELARSQRRLNKAETALLNERRRTVALQEHVFSLTDKVQYQDALASKCPSAVQRLQQANRAAERRAQASEEMADELYAQCSATAATLEKLLGSNSEFADKVNEQAVEIDKLQLALAKATVAQEDTDYLAGRSSGGIITHISTLDITGADGDVHAVDATSDSHEQHNTESTESRSPFAAAEASQEDSCNVQNSLLMGSTLPMLPIVESEFVMSNSIMPTIATDMIPGGTFQHYSPRGSDGSALAGDTAHEATETTELLQSIEIPMEGAHRRGESATSVGTPKNGSVRHRRRISWWSYFMGSSSAIEPVEE